MQNKTLEFVVDNCCEGCRLDVFLNRMIKWRSRSNLQQLIRNGEITVDGKKRRASYFLKEGMSVVTSIPDPSKALPETGKNYQIDVLYEDEFVMVINKPPFLACTPTTRHFDNNLVGLLRSRCRTDDALLLQPVHRLDRETSGVLIIAKTKHARKIFGILFETRSIVKEYTAIVQGTPGMQRGIVDVPIGRALHSEVKIKQETGFGKHAVTEYRVMKYYAEKDVSLLYIRPETGRPHQIRVHLAHLGCPIVGDKIYGPDERIFIESLCCENGTVSAQKLPFKRHALHAMRIEFLHPVSGSKCRIKAPMADDMAGFLRR